MTGATPGDVLGGGRAALAARLAGLYAIVDDAGAGRTLDELAAAALAGGARVLQLRCKRRTPAELAPWARAVAARVRDHGALLIVNDHLHLALDVGADGVHLGQGDGDVAEARREAGPGLVIGASTHVPAHLSRAVAAGADYVGFGPVYAPRSKVSPYAPRGLDLLAEVVASSPVPVVAIGGIDEERLADVLATGVSTVAVVSAICRAPDPEVATRRLVERIDAGSARAPATAAAPGGPLSS